MHSIGFGDRVEELAAAPQSSGGAPLPVVFADENRVLLSYLVSEIHNS